MEIWKLIEGFGSAYEVSSLGNVRSVKNKRNMALVASPNGYLKVCLYNGKKRNCYVHRLVAEAFLDGNGAQVNHKDGNKRNNRPENLEWSSPSENIKHAYAMGLMPNNKGEKNGNAKLTDKQTEEIRSAYRAGGISQRELAAAYGVTQATISRVIGGKVAV